MGILDQLQSLQFDPNGVLNTVFNPDPAQAPSFVGLNPKPQATPLLNAMAPAPAPVKPQGFLDKLANTPGLPDALIQMGAGLLSQPKLGPALSAGFTGFSKGMTDGLKMSLEQLKLLKPTMTATGQPGIMLATFPDGSTKTVVVDEAVKSYLDQQDRIDRREANRIDAQDRRINAQIEAADRRSNNQLSNAMAIATMKNDKKSLPATLQKSEDTDIEAVQGYQSNIETIAPIRQSLENGQLNLGALRNAYNVSRNFFGKSTPESQQYADLERNITRITNESLRLNKGVQTEGDAQRAAKEVLAAFAKNDTANMVRALKELEDINERAGNNKAKLIDTRRKSQGIEPMFGGQSPIFRPGAPAATGQGGDMVINGVTVKKVN